MNENISQQPASVKPVFLHHEKVMEGLNRIFGSSKNSVRISDPDVLEMLRIIPITPNSISLLSGIMGTGKTTYAEAFIKVFFGKESLGMIKCDPEKTTHETLYGTDVASETIYNYDSQKTITGTREIFVFDPHALSFVTKPVKFANEISRSSKAVQDALLGLFQEGEIEYRGKIFKTEKPFIALLDQNPLHLQGMGARELEPALIDRIDIMISLPTSNIFDDLAIQQNRESEHMLTQILDYATMKLVYEDVERVRRPLSIKFLTLTISQSLRACKYRKDISSPLFIESIDCMKCEYKNEICNSIDFPIGHRHLESILKFAASRAWLNKREEITIEDIMVVMPFALSHRLKLKAKAFMDSDSTYTWIREKALPYTIKQLSIYQEMLGEYIRTLEGSKDALLTISRKSKDNLLYQQMILRISEQLLSQGNRELDALEQTLLKLKKPNKSELEHAKSKFSSLKISKMVSLLTLKELQDIEAHTDTLSRYELGERVTKGNNGDRDRKDLTYQRINPFIKNLNALIQRNDNLEKVMKKAINSTKFETKLTEAEFMQRIFPVVAKHMNGDDLLEFGQGRIDTITQSIGNAEVEVSRKDGIVAFSIDADTREDLLETKKLMGL
jgi:MoxR-like ATPase